MATTMERHVGRLVELRTIGPQDPSRFGRLLALANEVGPEARVVLCADGRRADAGPPAGIEKVKMIIKASYLRVERAATLVDPDTLQGKQAARLHAELAIEGGRLCHTVADALAWLAPALTPAEQARLKQFLGS